MKCLLVSDPETRKSAATMHVASGDLNDPYGANGLAHLCERMLVLGTKKYPEESHYPRYIKMNEGSTRAVTSEDFTNYQFDVNKEVFHEALDIFSQFFK